MFNSDGFFGKIWFRSFRAEIKFISIFLQLEKNATIASGQSHQNLSDYIQFALKKETKSIKK